MGSCVYHTVSVIFVSKIITVLTGVKGKLQYLHARVPAVAQKLIYRLCEKSQIFGNDIPLSQLFFHGVEQIHTGTLFPMAVLCRLISIGDRIILVKSSEMVDPHNIKEFEAVGDPAHPPSVVHSLVIIPAVQGIAPELAGG